MSAELRKDTRELLRKELPHLDVSDVTTIEEEILRFCTEFCDAHNYTCSVNNPRFRKLYGTALRHAVRIASNNPDLISRKEQFLSISRDKLFPDVWHASTSAYTQRLQSAYESRKVAKTTQYVCPKCKHRECDFYEMQCRSADESMTLFIQCLHCSYSWHIS